MSVKYQLVLEWGERGLAASEAHAIVAVASGGFQDGPGRALLRVARAGSALVLPAELGDAERIAQRLLDEQLRLGTRVSIAIIAAGDLWPDGASRWSTSDLLIAGSIVDALYERGIDFHSPACAVAAAAYGSLRGAVRHLISAERRSRAQGQPAALPDPAKANGVEGVSSSSC